MALDSGVVALMPQPTTKVAQQAMANLRAGNALIPLELAALMRVDSKTVTRWAGRGLIGSLRTPGGHRRFPPEVVLPLLATGPGDREKVDAVLAAVAAWVQHMTPRSVCDHDLVAAWQALRASEGEEEE